MKKPHTTISVPRDEYYRLCGLKRDDENWGDTLSRLADAAEAVAGGDRE